MSHISADLVTHFCSGKVMGIKIALLGLTDDCCEMSNPQEDSGLSINATDKSACCQNQHQVLSLDQHTCIAKIVTDLKIKWQALFVPAVHVKCIYGFYDSFCFSHISLRRLPFINDLQSFLQVFLI